MPVKKHDPLENVLGRVEDLDKVSLSNLVSRLVRERRLLNTVFNAIREGILVIDANGIVQYANSASATLLGFSAEDAGSVNLWKAVPDLARTLSLTRSGQLAAETGISREIELSYPESRIVRLYIIPFEEEVSGVSLARFAVILADITQQKSQTRQEIESERISSILQLAAGVAHELGNPLNSLNIHLQVMLRTVSRMEEGPALEKLQKSLLICTGEVERLDGIITHFLQAVRPSPPDFSEVNLIQLLEESLEFIGPELTAAGLKVDVNVERGMPIVAGDRNQVKQVYYNILKNARQAMKGDGVIRIKAFYDDEFAYVQIADNGEGITEEDLSKVFVPYYTTKKGGHGLGMMIVERIMREHGGKIGIDSRPGVGTVVTLQLPQKHRKVRLLSD
jgi:two-component system, sporulation sensor kinase E